MKKLKQIIGDFDLRSRILAILVVGLILLSVYQGIRISSVVSLASKEKSSLNKKIDTHKADIKKLETEKEDLKFDLAKEGTRADKYDLLIKAEEYVTLAEKNVNKNSFDEASNKIDSLDDGYFKEHLKTRIGKLESSITEKEEKAKIEEEKQKVEEEKKKAEKEKAEKEAEEKKKKEEQDAAEEKKKEEEKKATEEANKKTKEATVANASREFKNALSKAEDYIDYTSFSKSGLYEQLIYESFPEDAAQFAIDNIVVDWKEQALLKAIDYLDYTSFSNQGLYDQLIYEGFSPEEAQYAIDNLPE